jgi:Cu/Ag efflux pump CusA
MVASILSAALRFRTLIVGVAAGLIVLGGLSLRQMHTDAVPELAGGPVLEVQTEAQGLSSAEVEQYVTVPMENNLLDGILGVWDTRSNSIPGLSSVDLYFEPGTTVLHARQLVQERLTNAFALPNVAKPPLLIQPISTSGRVMMIGLTAPPHMSSLQLSYLARWIIKPRLSGVPGVANVAIFGQQDQQIQVLADPSRLASHHVTLNQIIQTAGNAQLVSPLSFLEGSAPGTGGFLDGPNQRLEIRPVLPLGAPKDLAGVPITGAPGKQPLGSVANVVQSHQPLIGLGVVNGQPGLVLEIQKLPSASVRGVTDGIDSALKDLRPGLGGVRVDTSLFRPATYTTSATHNMAVAAIIAALLALLALGAWFLSVRSVFITFSAVAVSMVVAAWALDLLGYTLNPLVVVGLLIALMVVVDDATTATYYMVERLRARTQEGSTKRIQDVIFEACAPLRSTLGYATLLIILVTVPVFVSTGVTARFVHPMLLAFALAVVASLIVALTLTPALTMLLYDRGRPHRDKPALAGLRAGYRRILGAALSLPRPILILTCLAGLAGIIALPFLGQSAPPAFKDRNLVVQWNGPAGTSLTEMNRITTRVIGQLRSVPGVGDVGATLGRAVSGDQNVDTNSGQIYVAIKPAADYGSTLAAVRSVLDSTPGMQADVNTYEHDVTGGVLAQPTDQVDVRVYGEDYSTLNHLASQVSSVMSQVHGVGRPSIHVQTEEPNIEVAVDDEAALKAGVLPGDVRREASTLVSGLAVGNFFEQQAVFDVVVWGVPAVRQNLPTVRNLLIDTSNGQHVRLGSIAQVTIHHNPTDVQHDAFSRFVDVTANLHGTSRASVQGPINSRLERLSFPLEYHAEVVGGTPNDPTSHAAFLTYVAAALLGIILLLQAAVGSWRLAALLFLELPLALSGGVVVAALTGEISSLGAIAGLLGVLAFAVRHGLLVVTNIRRRHTVAGAKLDRELVLGAAAERAGPAVGTAMVLAVAMLPFLFMGDTAGGELTHATAAVILGGLLSTLLVNLLVLPAAYLVLGPVEPVPVEEPETATIMTSPAPSPS